MMLLTFMLNLQLLLALGVFTGASAKSHGVKDSKLLSLRDVGQDGKTLDIATYMRKRLDLLGLETHLLTFSHSRERFQAVPARGAGQCCQGPPHL